MKKFLFLTCALMCTFFMSAQKLTSVQVETAEGKMVDVTSLINGKPAIISFWSITCKPCIQELNAINDAMEEWLEQADFDVIAVSTDDARMKATAKARATSWGWDFTCIFDDNQDLKRALNVSLTPQSFVVDGEGNIVFSHTGYTPGSEEQLFEKILEISNK